MTKIELERENKHLLWMLMEFTIHRYLMANEAGRENECQKAENHLELSRRFIASKRFCTAEKADRYWEEVMKIHDATSALTAYMDTEIGFPVSERIDDWDGLSWKFFNRFIELAEEEWKQIEKK